MFVCADHANLDDRLQQVLPLDVRWYVGDKQLQTDSSKSSKYVYTRDNALFVQNVDSSDVDEYSCEYIFQSNNATYRSNKAPLKMFMELTDQSGRLPLIYIVDQYYGSIARVSIVLCGHLLPKNRFIHLQITLFGTFYCSGIKRDLA